MKTLATKIQVHPWRELNYLAAKRTAWKQRCSRYMHSWTELPTTGRRQRRYWQAAFPGATGDQRKTTV